MDGIYLDYNSTTPIDLRVADAMAAAYRAGYLNPASQHRSGQLARRALEESRSRIVSLLGAPAGGMRPVRLVFTSGGTEANNLILRGLSAREPRRQILVSAVEHPSVLGPAEYLSKIGVAVRMIPVDRQGVVCLDSLRELLVEPTALVSVMLANNETGVIQPLNEVVEICRARGVPVHTDAVQAIGRMPVDFSQLGVDAMTVAPHKFYGPRGIGGLLLHPELQIEPLLFGGFQQAGIRPGTEDVALAVGFQSALQFCLEDLPGRICHLQACCTSFLERVRASVNGPVVVNGELQARLPNTLNLGLPGLDRQALLMAADFAGLAISTGSACASGSSEPSPVLQAMGLERELVDSSVRISFGIPTTAAEVEVAAERFSRLVNELRN